MTDILDPAALISQLPDLLSPQKKQLSSPQDAVAALLHTIFVVVGFRLVAADDNSPTRDIAGNVLPAEWNKDGPSHYTFKYKHDQSSLDFELKIAKLGRRMVINAIAIENNKVETLDISTEDFVSLSFFPHTPGEGGDPLVHGFISSNRIADLVSQVKLKVLQKLVPSLRKDGYSEEAKDTSSNSTQSRPAPLWNPPPARPEPETPGHVPETFPPYSYLPPRNPFAVGRSDLDPIPLNPFSPPPLFPGSGDGMYVGPDHPIFRAPRGRGPFPDNRGPWGGDGFLPPMGAPPGARFDPIGPGPLPGMGGFGGSGRGSAPRRTGEPDNDEFMPPGMDQMFM